MDASPPSASLARMTRDLAALVAIDSSNPPCGETKVARLLEGWLREIGFVTKVDEFAPGRANLVGRLENGPGPVFAFNTHIDTVPLGQGWSTDPLTLTERAGRLHGRGACDCKGPLAAMVEAMRLLTADRASWRGTLTAVFVADEEVASAGARHFARTGPRIDFAVIGEPTSNAVVVAHKGSLRPLVRVHGTAAHSGSPERGDNAIYRAARLISFIEAFQDDVVRHRVHPLLGAASLTITRADAGTADNVVPDRCDLLLDRRTLPGEDEGEVRTEIQGLLEQARERFDVRAEVVDWRPTTGGACETEVGQPLVAAALLAAQRHGVAVPGPIGFQGACDFVHFRAMGAEALVLGPGNLAVAHQPDEFVPVDELVASSLIYRDIARAMLPAA